MQQKAIEREMKNSQKISVKAKSAMKEATRQTKQRQWNMHHLFYTYIHRKGKGEHASSWITW